jgi:fatty acid desaturase
MRANLLLAAALIATQAALPALCALAPGGALPPGGALALVLLCLVATTPYWSMLHEAIHGSADANPRLNGAIGRVMGILFGSPFSLLRTGHLLHHRFNRTAEVSEAYEPSRTPRALAWGRHYATILGGLYWAEVIGGLVLLLPRRWWPALLGGFGADERFAGAALAQLARPAVRRAARQDACAIVLLYGSIAMWFGLAPSTAVPPGRWLLLLAALCVRGLLVSFFDNAYHYGTVLGNRRAARNLVLPLPLARFILNFNFHGVHHLEPWVPWFELPRRARVLRIRPADGFFRTAARQLRGPIPFARLRSVR